MKAEQQIAAIPRSAVLLQYVIYDSRHVVELHGIQPFQAGHHFGGLLRRLRVEVEEITGGHVKIFADIENPVMEGSVFPLSMLLIYPVFCPRARLISRADTPFWTRSWDSRFRSALSYP